MSVVVTFESTINEELRTALESGNDIKITYETEGDKVINKDRYLTVKKYQPYETVAKHKETYDAKKIRQSAIYEKERDSKSKLSRMVANNSFSALTCE